uniref:Uncharacterized protein n=1 Tax=Caenorhabditis japonica TaxID=281687 RepID=A0A8R1DYP5_CAEJA
MEDNRKRNLDRRRETSRHAARDRRGKEADIFGELRDCVPLVDEGSVTHLDRIALLRVAATICRLRKTAGNVLENDLSAEVPNQVWTEETISECLDGFVMIVDSDSSILYVTESVALYLGLTQTDLTGRALRDFLHPSDYDEFDKQSKLLHKPRGEESDGLGANLVLRMKTVISPRGRCLNLKSALYKPVSFLIHSKVSTGGHVCIMQGITIPAGQGTTNSNSSSVTKYSESPMGAFTTRHTCDMRITFVSDKFNYILKSEFKTLMGTSFYDLVHPADMVLVGKAMKELFSKGHVRTPYYRLVAASNNLAWIQTEASTINHTTKGQKGQYVICVHYVLGIQGAEESLVVCTDSMPAGVQVDIKKEIDDTRDYIGRQPEIVECVDFTPLIEPEDPFEMDPICQDPKASDIGARKNSYDDVLQWLFRDQPSSPPPTRYRSAERFPTEPPPHFSTSLASSQFMDSSPRASRPKTSYGRRAQSSGSRTTPCSGGPSSQQSHYSTLTEGVSQSGINSPPSVQSKQLTYGNARPMVGCVDSPDPSRRFSAVPSSDPFDVSPVEQSGCGIGMQLETPSSDVFAAMPFADSLSADGNQTPTLAGCEPILCDDLQWEEPDLSCLAPFVDTCDMMQIDEGLPPELQALYDLPDFTPSVPSAPAARPVHIDRSPPAKRMALDDMDYTMYSNQYQPFQQDPFWQPADQQQQSASATYSPFPMLS